MRQTSSSRYAVVDDPAGDAANHLADHVKEHLRAPVVMLPCAVATNSALGCAIARTFAEAGWDICVYFDVRHPGERADAEHCCAMVASLGRRAVALPVDTPGLGHSSGASALLARCADPGEGLGRLPRCLVNAPAQIDSETMAATPMRIADGDVAPNVDGSVLLRLTEVNVAPALALSQAFHRAWREIETPADAGADANGIGNAAANAAANANANAAANAASTANGSAPDLAIINMIDSGGANGVGSAVDPANAANASLDRLAFALTQASLRAATPLLARAFAPWVRVAGLSTRLVSAPVLVPTLTPTPTHASDHAAAEAVGHHTEKKAAKDGIQAFDLTDAVCEAVLFLADARTITGSILLADGGAQVHRAAPDTIPSVGQSAALLARKQSVASMSDTAQEIAADPHGE